MTLRDYEKVITKHLIKHFNEGKQNQKHKDFFFTSAKLSKDLPVDIDVRVIGRVLKYFIAPTGIIRIWSPRKVNSNHALVWVTCFNGGTYDV